MEKYNLSHDIKVFGIRVKTFPNDVGETFNELIKKTGDRAGERNYYGIAEYIDGEMFYYAMAEEKFSGEAETYNYEKYTIESGEFLVQALSDWQKKTACIKDIFNEMLKSEMSEKTKPCIEWYKNDEEMWCMLRSRSGAK